MPKVNESKIAKIKTTSLSAAKWGKNAAKSFGMVGFEVTKEMAPVTKSLVESASTLKSMIMGAIDTADDSTMGSKLNSGLSASMSELKTAMKNAKEDFLSGKFHNTARMDKAMEESMGLGFDLGDDLDWGDDGWDDDFGDIDDNSSSISKSSTVNVINNTGDDHVLVKAMANNTEMSINIAETQMKHSSKLSISTMNAIAASTGKIVNALDSINQNIGLLVQFQSSSMNSYIAASMKFYDEQMARTNDILERISKVIETRAPQQRKPGERRDKDGEYAFGFDGTFDMNSYKDIVKKNVSNMTSMLGLDMIEMMSDQGMFSSAFASPLSMVLSGVIKKSIPVAFEKSLKDFDRSMGTAIAAIANKMNDWRNDYSNPLKNMIGSIFGVDVEYKKKIDLRKYDKGPRPFDGKAHKALTEVIPGYLAKMVSLLSKDSNTPVMVMDYEKGRMVSLKDVQAEYNNRVSDRMNYAYGSAYGLKRSVEYNHNLPPRSRRRYGEAIDALVKGLTELDAPFNPREIDGDSGIKRFIEKGGVKLSDREYRTLSNLINSLPKDKLMAMASRERWAARRDISDYHYDIENGGDDVYRNIINGMFTNEEINRGQISKMLDRSPIPVREKDPNVKKISTITTSKIQGHGKLGRDIRNQIQRKTGYSAPLYKVDDYFDYDIHSTNRWFDKIPVINKVFDKLAKWLDSAGTMMYDIVFADPDADEENKGMKGFFSKVMSSTKNQFKKFFGYLKENVYEPVKEFFFGEDGLVAKFKESPLWQGTKEKYNSALDYLFGEKDADGYRRDGFFSQTFNNMKDMGKNFVSYFTGAAYTNAAGVKIDGYGDKSVFAEMKSMFSNFANTMGDYFFGKDKRPTAEDAKGVVYNVFDSLKNGFQSFSDALFGTKEQRESVGKKGIDVGESWKEIKDKAPKAFASGIFGAGAGILFGSKLGLLGSLFLPGGPVGGAIIGTAIGFASQSEKFKDWLFGEFDEGNQERVGGIINKNFIDFFKKNRIPLIGGGTIGAIKGAIGGGFLPGLLLGGPIGGAIMGMASAMVFKSEAFQNAMFGKLEGEGDDQRRVGGLLQTLTGHITGSFNKDVAGKMGAGAIGGATLGLILSKFGILGGLMFGPGGGAVVGAAAGIALASEKWKKALFGEMVIDEETNELVRDGGLLGRFTNKVNLEVLQPFKIKMLESAAKFEFWVDDKIAEPIRSMIEPVTHELKHIQEKIGEGITSVIDAFMTSRPVMTIQDTFKRIEKGFEDWIFKPVRTNLGRLFNMVAKISGLAISSPFRLLGAGTDWLMSRQIRRGLRSKRREWWADDELSFGQKLLKSGKSFFRGTAEYDEGAYGPDGAGPGAKQWLLDRAARKQARQAKRDEKLANINKMKEMLDSQRSLAESMGWGVRDENGNLNTSAYKDVVESTLGKKFGKDYKGMSKLQKDQFQRTLKADKDRSDIRDSVTGIGTDIKSIISIMKDGAGGGKKKRKKKGKGVSVTAPDGLNSEEDVLLDDDTAEANQKVIDQAKKGSAIQQKIANVFKDKEKEKEKKNKTVVESLQETASNLKEHKNNWLSMFGKTGMITLALLGLWKYGGKIFEFLKDNFFPWMKGQGNASRTDAEGEAIINQSYAKITATTPIHAAARMMVKGGETVTKLRSMADEGTSVVGKFLSKFKKGNNVVDKGIKAAASDAPYWKVLDNAAEETVEQTAKNKGLLKRFIDDALKFFDVIATKFAKKFPKAGAIIGKLKGAINESKLASYITKIRKVAAEASLEGVGKTINKVLMITGFVTGALDASRMFGVPEEDVDWWMRGIASLIQGILDSPIPVMWVIEILNVFLTETMGVNFIRWIATTLYGAIIEKVSKGKFTASDNKVTRGQSEIKARVQAYNEKNNTSISVDAYLDKFQPSTFSKIGRSFTKKGKKLNADIWKEQVLRTGVDPDTGRPVSPDKVEEMYRNKQTGLLEKSWNATKKLASGGWGALKKTVRGVDERLAKFDTSAQDASKKFGIGMFNMISAPVRGIGALSSTLTNLPDIFSKINTGVSKWAKEGLRTEKGKLFKDPRTNRTVTPNTMHSYVTNTMSKMFGNVLSLLSAADMTIEMKINGKPVSTTPTKEAYKATGPRIAFGGGTYEANAGDMYSPTLKKHPSKPGVFIDEFGNLLGTGGLIETDMVNAYRTTSGYGKRKWGHHTGIDLVSGVNKPIQAFTDGKVVKVVNSFAPNSGTFNPKGGPYGNFVQIEDSWGHNHVYAHLNGVRVRPGDKIGRGQVIGIEGHTGNSTGPHLHYEVRRNRNYGTDINPLEYLRKYNSQETYNGPKESIATSGTGRRTGLVGLHDLLSETIDNAYKPFSAMSDELNKILSSVYGENEVEMNIKTGSTTGTGIGLQSGQFMNQNLKQFNPISESELNAWIKSKRPDSPFNGKAHIFIRASKETGLDPRYILAHAALESGWGTSSISKNKNNFFGIGAFDRSPYASAYSFASGMEAGILGGAKWIADNYTNKGQETLFKMANKPGHSYASDPEWGPKIAKLMSSMPQGTSVALASSGKGPTPMGGGTFEAEAGMRKIFNRSQISSTSSLERTITNAASNVKSPKDMEIFMKLLEVLIEIAKNTGTSNDLLESIKTTGMNTAQANIIANTTNNNTSNSLANKSRINREDAQYALAKKVARGI